MFELCIGAILGILSSIPIGPINLAIIALALKTSWQRPVAMAITVALIDGIYAFIAVSAISLPHWSDPVTKICGLFGSLLVAGYGVYLIFSANGKEKSVEQNSLVSSRHNICMGVLTGAVLYVSNPSFIIFWLSAISVSRQLFPDALLQNYYLFGAGVVSGTSLWFFFLLYLIRRKSIIASPVLKRRLSIIVGWLLIALGIFSLVSSIKELVR
ncbi:MAG: LysE family transporter [Spirochaetota bacterium]